MVSRLDVEVLPPPNGWDGAVAMIGIEGRELLDIIREVEITITASTREQSLAGKYQYLGIE